MLHRPPRDGAECRRKRGLHGTKGEDGAANCICSEFVECWVTATGGGGEADAVDCGLLVERSHPLDWGLLSYW